jgi:hypothetical protein
VTAGNRNILEFDISGSEEGVTSVETLAVVLICSVIRKIYDRWKTEHENGQR